MTSIDESLARLRAAHPNDPDVRVVAGEIENLRYALGDIRDDADNGWTDCVTGAADVSSYEAEAFERIRRTATLALADGFLNTPVASATRTDAAGEKGEH
jgi:hypothetical protein